MVTSDDRWVRSKQQKDFERREEDIIDQKIITGRSILEEGRFEPWVQDVIRVDTCGLHFTCDACGDPIPLALDSLRKHLGTLQHDANMTLWVERHPERRRTNWQPRVRVDTLGAPVSKIRVDVDDTIGVAVVDDYTLNRTMKEREAAAVRERDLKERQRRANAHVPAWHSTSRTSTSSQHHAIPATQPVPPPTATPQPLPAVPPPPPQPAPVMWWETPDHYRTRMRWWYGGPSPGQPPTPADHCPHPIRVETGVGIHKHELDIHYQIRVEAYNRWEYSREPIFRQPLSIPPPGTAAAPASIEGANHVRTGPEWNPQSRSHGGWSAGTGSAQPLTRPSPAPRETPWDPPESVVDRGVAPGTWGPAVANQRQLRHPEAQADPRGQPFFAERTTLPVPTPEQRPIVRPAPRPRSPRGLWPMQSYTCPASGITYDGMSTHPPLVEFVNALLHEIGMPSLTSLERTYVHRTWAGGHASNDELFAADYLQRVLHWRER